MAIISSASNTAFCRNALGASNVATSLVFLASIAVVVCFRGHVRNCGFLFGDTRLPVLPLAVDPPRALVAAAVSEVLLTAPGRDVNRAALEDFAGSLVEAFDSRVAEGSILPILTVFLGVASCFVVFLFINSASSGCARVLYQDSWGRRTGRVYCQW